MKTVTLRTICMLGLLWLSFCSAIAGERPNVVWFVVDDMSANFSCYGEKTIQTPHVDQLAKEGLRFTRAYATSSVCSTFRSALITGMYQTTIGAHHHRSGHGTHRITLPDGARPVPSLFQEAGYYTCIGSGLQELDFRSQPFSTSTRSCWNPQRNFTSSTTKCRICCGTTTSSTSAAKGANQGGTA